MTDDPMFEIVHTKTGAISIRNRVVNEIMHNPVGPWAEANALYIDQSRFRERIREPSADPLVVFDVGLGAAANALAALACLKDARRPLHLVSFEKDLELLRFALAHADCFEHFRGFEEAIQSLLRDSVWIGDGVRWELRHGDFLESIAVEPTRAHLIFYDPYSPKMNEEMWTTTCFRKVRARSREVDDGGTALYTYSRATPIRTALIAAGFFVGRGQATGLKSETTVAATSRNQLADPLDHLWRDRWRRSHARLPYDCEPQEAAAMDQFIETYFSSGDL